MPSISGPAIISTKSSGTLVNAVNLALNFIGFTVSDAGNGQTNITGGGGGGGSWLLAGNALTGPSPDAPNEFFGSTNDFDVVLVRGGTQYARLTTDGAFFGPDTNPNGFYFTAVTASLAFGDMNVSDISTTGTGCLVFGQCSGFNIQTGGAGNLAGGRAESGHVSIGNFFGSIAFGDDIQITTGYAQAFGQGHIVSFSHSMTIGRYSDTTASPVDPLFTIGNGANAGSRSNAYRIDDDGRQTTTASHVNQAIDTVAGASVLDARVNRTILYDTNGAGGNLDLPVGEDGLEMIFSPMSGGAAAYTLVANGGDTIDAAVTTALTGQVERIQFFSGVWYSI